MELLQVTELRAEKVYKTRAKSCEDALGREMNEEVQADLSTHLLPLWNLNRMGMMLDYHWLHWLLAWQRIMKIGVSYLIFSVNECTVCPTPKHLTLFPRRGTYIYLKF